MQNVLITSTSCGCCKGYTELVKELLPDIVVVNASSLLGKELLDKYQIKGLPTIIFNDEVLTGKFSKEYLKNKLTKTLF